MPDLGTVWTTFIIVSSHASIMFFILAKLIDSPHVAAEGQQEVRDTSDIIMTTPSFSVEPVGLRPTNVPTESVLSPQLKKQK